MAVHSVIFIKIKSRLWEVQEIAPPVFCSFLTEKLIQISQIQQSIPRDMTGDPAFLGKWQFDPFWFNAVRLLVNVLLIQIIKCLFFKNLQNIYFCHYFIMYQINHLLKLYKIKNKASLLIGKFEHKYELRRNMHINQGSQTRSPGANLGPRDGIMWPTT